jgi:hypothetical protein
MPTGELYMDVDAVSGMAQQFGSLHDALQSIGSGLEAAIALVKTTAIFGQIGTTASDEFANDVKPLIDNMAARLLEIQSEVQDAINHYQTGDTSGSGRFRS